METAGLLVGVIGLAGLFNAVLEVAGKVQDYNAFDSDSKTLNAQFKGELVRFERWGRHVGIDKDRVPAHSHTGAGPATVDAVQDLLRVALSALKARAEASTKSKHSLRQNRALWALNSKRIQEEDLRKFARVVQQLHDLSPLLSAEETQPKTRGVDPAEEIRLQRMIEKLIAERNVKQPKARKAVFAWVSGSKTSEDKFSDALKCRLEDTCDWILGRPEIHSWLDLAPDNPNILWLNGHAGFGKTVICAHLTSILSDTLDTPVASFFSSGFVAGEDAYIVLRSWISQLIRYDDEAFALVFSEWKPSPYPVATRTTICQLLKTLLYMKKGSTLIVDGLDECTTLLQNQPSVGKMIRDLREAMAEDTRVLIVSRYEHEIQRALKEGDFGRTGEMTLTTEDVKKDLRVVSDDIFTRKVSKRPDDPRRGISERMVLKCDGQFQWLKMQEDALKSWMKLEQLQRKIEDTPTELHEIYHRNWRRIQRSKRSRRAFSILRWTACSVRPLTVAEIAEAALIDEQEGDFSMDDLPEEINEDYVESEIHELCSPLLKIRRSDLCYPPSSWTVHVAHFTVREYLVQQLPVSELELGPNAELQRNYEQMQNSILAQSCLNYVRSLHVWEISSDQSPIFFRDYASTAWHVHVNQSMLSAVDSKTMKLALGFMTESHPCWIYWRKWFDKHKEDSYERNEEPDTMPPDPLYYALKLHLRSVVSEKLKVMQHMPQQSSPGRSAFHVACTLGDISTVQTFLDAGTDVHLRGWGGRTPIFTAAVSGQTALIRMLLNRGGDVNITKWAGNAPLHTAIDNDHFETAKLLLNEGARLDARNPRGWVPVAEAAWRGRINILELMLDMGGTRYINSQSIRGLTPVHMSVVTEHLNVVKCLVERGADIHLGDRAGWLPVHAAAGRGHVQILQVLLDEGADINTPVRSASLQEGFVGWTAIHLSAYYHRKTILEHLLKTGALNDARLKAITASRGETPLHLAATSGHTFAVQLFLGRSPDLLNEKDTSGHTALFLATQQSHENVIRVLLNDDRVNINEGNYYGNTPLDAAVRNGHSRIVELLLVAASSKLIGKQTLEWARLSNSLSTLRLLEQAPLKLYADDIKDHPEVPFIGRAAVPFVRQRAWCYSCTLSLPKNTAELGHRCVSCDGGYLYLCVICVGQGAKCRDPAHALMDLQEGDIQNRHEYVNDASAMSYVGSA